MCMKLREYQNEIKRYCDRNNLSFDKIMTSIKGCGNDSIIFQIAGDKQISKVYLMKHLCRQF